MKKILAMALVLITLALCFSSCGPKDAIRIAPHDLNMPDSYEILYTVVTDSTNDENDSVALVVCGCDAEGNFYFSEIGKTDSYNNVKKLCIGSDDSYDEYSFDEETGKYELVAKDRRWVDAFVACSDYIEYANDETDKGSYEKIDALSTSPIGTIDFSDTERFEYYRVTGGSKMSGKPFEAVVEKETGACVYVKYLEPSIDGTDYYFYATKYTTPFEGNYKSLFGDLIA